MLNEEAIAEELFNDFSDQIETLNREDKYETNEVTWHFWRLITAAVRDNGEDRSDLRTEVNRIYEET